MESDIPEKIKKHQFSHVIKSKTLNEYPINLEETEYEECDYEETGKTVIRSKKVRIKTTPSQKNTLKKWFKFYRDTYNETIIYIRSQIFEFRRKYLVKLNRKLFEDAKINKIPKNKKLEYRKKLFTFLGKFSLKNLRNIINQRLGTKLDEFEKYKFPVHTKNIAIRDVCNAYKTCITLVEKEIIPKFLLRTKSKFDEKYSLVLEEQSFSKKFIDIFCVNSFKESFKVREKDSFSQHTINHECVLQYDRLSKKIYLFIPCDKPVSTLENKKEKCAIDPGLRIFTNIYDGENFYSLDNDLLEKIKKVHIKLSKSENMKKKNIRRRLSKLRNKVIQMHWNIINKLTDRYDKIYIGRLWVKSICKKGGNLCKSQKDLSYLLSHYKFRERLKAKCGEKSVKYVEVNESYTSKTCGKCGKCGKLKENLGGNKNFKCDLCGLKINRDFNGARNIMIKAEKFYKI